MYNSKLGLVDGGGLNLQIDISNTPPFLHKTLVVDDVTLKLDEVQDSTLLSLTMYKHNYTA